ncbi:MAG: diguanylate cyclase [Oscillospiraceae bacterium]|nr:diguanylate cyclase [Oscillospiraceae bacterium]
MDLQAFADGFQTNTCIMSVEALPDGNYGTIRIVTGNRAYMESAGYVAENSSAVEGKPFLPNQPYEHYIPKDLNFEDFCYRSAVLRQPMHTYIHLERFNFWLHIFMLPINYQEGNVCYCTYTQEFTQQADTSMMTGNLSPEVSSAVLNTCIKLRSAKNFQETMDEVIQDIGTLCDAGHCCVFLTDFAQRKCSVLCEALGKGTSLKSMNTYVNDEFFKIAETWDDTIAGSSCFIVDNEASWNTFKERNPLWHDSLVMAGAESLVLFPLKDHGETLGYIWAINFDTSRTVQIKEMLELTTYFLASEIANHQLFKKLERLSSIDLLTGVYNRNAMNNRVDELCSFAGAEHPDSVGIVFADLNGLKQINDNEGHSAGDDLLKSASAVLRNVFPEYEIYRAGGDEFMIIAVNIPETELIQRAVRMEHYPENPEHVSFAVGYCCDSDCSCIRNTMHVADERMYQNKELYYKKHPEKRRR